jgi:hypothetical protein
MVAELRAVAICATVLSPAMVVAVATGTHPCWFAMGISDSL